ncbi:transposase, partial [Pedobacter paludis]|uniref:transposase n=1 Tax=Pedobacter paludis TaxID=2203212 RepID=UPI0029371550
SSPEIAIQKRIVMRSIIKSGYQKRTQKDYSLSFKHQIVFEIEQGELSTTGALKKYGIQSRSTIIGWLRKYGNFDWENQTPSHMPKTPEQKILELEAKVKLLEKQNAFLAAQNTKADKKAIIFDMMIDIAEKEYNIEIRKNSSPEQLNNTKKPTKKA